MSNDLTSSDLMSRERFESALTFREFLEEVEKFAELWHGVAQRAKVPQEFVDAFSALPGHWNLVAMAEDWCFDAINPLPVISRLADEVPNLSMKVLHRDENLDLIDAHLTNQQSRSIPIVIIYDEEFGDRGCWGTRPKELQKWIDEVAPTLPPEEKSKYHRRWYARDKGVSTLREILSLIQAEI